MRAGRTVGIKLIFSSAVIACALLLTLSSVWAQTCLTVKQCIDGNGEVVGDHCSGPPIVHGKPICGAPGRSDVINKLALPKKAATPRLNLGGFSSDFSPDTAEEDMAHQNRNWGEMFANWLSHWGESGSGDASQRTQQQQQPQPPQDSLAPWLNPGAQGSPIFRLGMYIAPATTSGVDGGAGFAVTRGSGYSLNDTAGLLAPGAKTANFRETIAGGKVGGFLDLSGMLSANQSLLLRGFYGYSGSKTSFGDAPELGLVGLDIGSVKQDTHTLGSSISYGINSFYVRGAAAVNLGHGRLTNNTDGSTGDYDTRGYATDLRIGNLFTLARGVAYARPAGYTKSPPRPIPTYLVGLDLSGHVGYFKGKADSFTDSSGFVYGDERARYGDVGARAKLLAFVPGYGRLWSPYIAGTVDQQFGFSHNVTFPNQVQLVGGDIVTYSQALTFWGVEGGLDVLNGGVSGWRVGAKGFYIASSDTNTAGGQLYLKIPLFQGPPVLR